MSNWWDYDDEAEDEPEAGKDPLRIRDILKAAEDLDVDDPDGDESINSRLATQQVEVKEQEEEEFVEAEDEWVDPETPAIGDEEEATELAVPEMEAQPETEIDAAPSPEPDAGPEPVVEDEEQSEPEEDTIDQNPAPEQDIGDVPEVEFGIIDTPSGEEAPQSQPEPDNDPEAPSDPAQPIVQEDLPAIEEPEPGDEPEIPGHLEGGDSADVEIPDPVEVEQEEQVETPEMEQPQAAEEELPSTPDAEPVDFEIPSTPDAPEESLQAPSTGDVAELNSHVPSVEIDEISEVRPKSDEPPEPEKEWDPPEMPEAEEAELWTPRREKEDAQAHPEVPQSSSEPSGFLGETVTDPVREGDSEGASDLHDIYDITAKRVASVDRQADDMTKNLLEGLQPMFDDLRLRQEMVVHDTMTRMIAEQQMLDDY